MTIHYDEAGKVDRGYYDTGLADRAHDLSDALDAANKKIEQQAQQLERLRVELEGAQAAFGLEHKIAMEAQEQIASLEELQRRMRTMLAVIAYPQRGTNEERLDIQAAANFIQHHFTRAELGLDADALKDAP